MSTDNESTAGSEGDVGSVVEAEGLNASVYKHGWSRFVFRVVGHTPNYYLRFMQAHPELSDHPLLPEMRRILSDWSSYHVSYGRNKVSSHGTTLH